MAAVPDNADGAQDKISTERKREKVLEQRYIIGPMTYLAYSLRVADHPISVVHAIPERAQVLVLLCQLLEAMLQVGVPSLLPHGVDCYGQLELVRLLAAGPNEQRSHSTLLVRLLAAEIFKTCGLYHCQLR